ncbi:unnamed protein product [Rotaria sp. Silwood1]|nr:unnamed protein product [Rotaria sp. Silwood1]
MIFGKGNISSGFIAYTIVGLFVLGCNCNKQFGSVSNISTTPSNTPKTFSNTETPTTTTPTYTKSDASKGVAASEAESQDIAKTTLLDFNDAIQSADFTTFYGNVAKAWQKQTSPDKMKALFQAFIDGRANMSQIKSLDAKFTTPPSIETTIGLKTLVLRGEYATTSIPTTFELKYVAEGKDWKLIAIKVYTAIKK